MDTISAQARQPSVPNVISKGGLYPVTVSGRADSASDLTQIAIVVGKAGSPPTTFAGFTSGTTQTFLADQASVITWRIAGFAQSYSFTFQGGLAGPVSVGDTVYVALFEVPAPSGSDPVIALALPLSAGE